MADNPFFTHQDRLTRLHDDIPVTDKLVFLHNLITESYPFITRIAVALYDAKTDQLKTYIHSSRGDVPLVHYQAQLSDSPSLREIVEAGQPRVVNDLAIFSQSDHEHAKRIGSQGYQASYTLPIYNKGTFIGFLFYNSVEKEAFSDEVLHTLDLFSHLISLTIIHELANFQILVAALNTIKDISHHRDSETGTHLDRMSRYARLIARSLSPKHGLTDEFVELLFMYAPLHDIGKIAIPDEILLKKSALSPDEYSVMKSHTIKGRKMIDAMLDYFGMGKLEGSDMLRNIAELHHEALSGNGYPYGLQGEAIPLEARIVAVADIFDALTSRRPYKEAWSNEQAAAKLQEMAGHQLDRECVAAIVENLDEVARIQAMFKQDIYG